MNFSLMSFRVPLFICHTLLSSLLVFSETASGSEYSFDIEKFEKQVELAPERANSYDSLGDGYRAAGRKEEAITAYKKAVEIDPEFSPSKKNLEELQDE